MKRLSSPRRLVTRLFLPVLLVGGAVAAAAVFYLLPPVVEFLEHQTDERLTLASGLGIKICETNLNTLLDMRLENDSEMIAALTRESIAEIKGISRQLRHIRMLVVKDGFRIIGASEPPPRDTVDLPSLIRRPVPVQTQTLWGSPVRLHYRYFPFWRWHIISFVPEDVFLAPVRDAERAVYLGTFGVLAAALMALLVTFNLLVQRPLKRLMTGTRRVAEGRFEPVDAVSRNEIGELVAAFNTMVASLNEKESQVDELIRALKRSEEYFRKAFLISPDAITITHLETGVIVEINRGFTEITGYEWEDIAGRSMLELNLWENPSDRERLVAELKARGHVRNLEARFWRKDGRLLDGLLSANRIELDGAPHLLTIARDITELKETTAAFRESEKRYAILFEQANDAIFLVSFQDEILDVNRRACELLGYTREELIGMVTADIQAPECRGPVGETIRGEMETHPGRVFESIDLRKDGGTVPVEVSNTVISEAELVFSVVRDISGRKKAEETLRELDKQAQQVRRMESVATLAAGIAHDFNNQLMAIQGRASLMRLDLDASHPHQKSLQTIEDAVSRAGALTAQLLGFARGGKYHVRPADLNHLIREAVDRHLKGRESIRVVLELAPSLGMVSVDHRQMHQVLANLLINACQAMAEGGTLTLRTRNIALTAAEAERLMLAPGDYASVEIVDTGVGMSAETAQYIFDPFFTTGEKSRVSGLGLAAAYGILRNHGGMITVESEKDRGSTFRFYLPVNSGEAPEVRTGPPVENVETGNETVLLVDDNAMVLELGKDMLETLGYSVKTAESGLAALSILETHYASVDVVVLDLMMPHMGGGETFDLMKERYPGIRVILSSGYSIDGDAEGILARGCRGFIQKPFTLQELSRIVREVLDAA